MKESDITFRIDDTDEIKEIKKQAGGCYEKQGGERL